MIVASIQDAARYKGLSAGLDIALDFLAAGTSDLETGRVDIADGVFANVMEVSTVAADAKPFEAHVDYLDVQFVERGEELLLEYPMDIDSQDYGDHDVALFDGVATSSVRLDEGRFCIVWPGEAHKPSVRAGATDGKVRKIVVKVPVDR